MQIRDALKSDLEVIVAIYNQTIPGRLATADLEPVSVSSKEPWFNAHNKDIRPLWVMENETGEIIAWASFQSFYGRPAYNHTAELSIYVADANKGKGIGTILLTKAIADCKRLDIKNLLGFIFGHNLPSLNLFYKFGFENWANMPGIAVLDGVERDLIIVGKKIH